MSSSHGTLVIATRGIKARHRHLQRDILKLLPHGRLGAKMGAEDELKGILGLCEDAACENALLLDARDPHRLYMWVAGCPDGPSAMFRVSNVHTVAELKLDSKRAAATRTLLVFDSGFEESAERRVMKALLTRTFATPCHGKPKTQPDVKHTLTFTWLDGRVWVRAYRITPHAIKPDAIDVMEIGPRMVLEPIRIIAAGFGGAILYSSDPR